MTRFLNFKNLFIVENDEIKKYILENLFDFYVNYVIVVCKTNDKEQIKINKISHETQKKIKTRQIILNYYCMTIWKPSNNASYFILDSLLLSDVVDNKKKLINFIISFYENDISYLRINEKFYEKENYGKNLMDKIKKLNIDYE